MPQLVFNSNISASDMFDQSNELRIFDEQKNTIKFRFGILSIRMNRKLKKKIRETVRWCLTQSLNHLIQFNWFLNSICKIFILFSMKFRFYEILFLFNSTRNEKRQINSKKIKKKIKEKNCTSIPHTHITDVRS